MKAKKIIALTLACSMMMGVVAGCSKVSKVSNKSMTKAADKLDAVVYEDYEEFLEDGEDDIEDGVLVTLDKDAIEDALDEYDFDEDEIDDAVDMINDILDTDIDFSIDDIEEMALYGKVDDEPNVCVVAYIDLGNDEIAGQLFQGILDAQDDINDYVEDALEYMELDDIDYFSDFEFDLEQLSKDEFYFNGKDKGYLKTCVTIDRIEEFIEEDLPDILDDADLDVDEDDIEDVIDELEDEMPFEVAAFGVYFNGSKIVVTMIVSDDDDFIDDYESFMKTIGLASPTKVKLSDYAIKLAIVTLVPNVTNYINRATYAASQVAAHNQSIDEVTAMIDEYDY